MEKRLKIINKMRKKRIRLISSISDVITNSSTQVFLLEVDDKLKKLNSEKLNGQVLIAETKEDILRYVDEYEQAEKEGKGWENEIFYLLGQLIDDDYCLINDGYPTDFFRTICEKGEKSYREVIEFFWPLIEENFGNGKAYYSWEDDSWEPEEAKILYKEGYDSERDS